MLNAANHCTLSKEETQGPYWFDVDSIRSDIREKRPGTKLELAIRALDRSRCEAGNAVGAVADSVVEIWHCDAGGVYSGFESGGMGGGPGGGSSGGTSDGTYSQGDQEAQTSDDGTYLRGAQVANKQGVVRFTTIYPGWYQGRVTHIHLKVHVDKKTRLTSQLFFHDDLNSAVYATAPYTDHQGNPMTIAEDSIYDPSGLVNAAKNGSGYLAAINLAIT